MLYLFRLRELLCCRELLNCSLATALLAALSSPSPGFRAAPRWFMQVVAGQTEGPCQPCPPVTRDPLPPRKSPQTCRPTDLPAIGRERGAASAQLSSRQQRPPLQPPVTTVRSKRVPPRGELGPGNLANGIRFPPARWEDGTTPIPL